MLHKSLNIAAHDFDGVLAKVSEVRATLSNYARAFDAQVETWPIARETRCESRH